MKPHKTGLIINLLFCFVIFPVQAQARDVNEYIVRTGWGEIRFVRRPDLGYITVSSQEPAAEEAMVTTLKQFDAKEVQSVKGAKRRGFSITLNKAGTDKNEKTISALAKRNEIRYVTTLFSSNGQTVAILPEIVVKLISEKESERFQKTCDNMNLVIERKLEYTEDEYLIRVYVADANTVFDIVEKLNKYAFIKWVVPNVAFRPQLCGQVIPDDTYFQNQWHLRNTGQSGGTLGADINAPAAWEITTGDPNIIIAVLDQGVDTNHPDLAANIVPGYDFYDDDNIPDPNGNDAHGTACAGLIAAHGNNGLGVTGVAWNCKIMPIRISGDDFITESDIATAIRWAASNGADIMSNSWGGSFDMPVIHSALHDVTEPNGIGRDGKGCVVLFAAGNFVDWGLVFWPAKYPEVIAVGATDKNDVYWSYSGRGYDLDIVAPSGDCDLEGDLWTTDIVGSAGYNNRNPSILDYTDKMGGTSGACPIAAGVAALVLSVDPNLTDIEVAYILERSAVNLGDPTYYGHGRVDANAALNLVLNPTPTHLIYVDDNAPNDPGPADPNVSDPNEDGSIEHPFDSIQEAIDITEYGDEVVILEGAYTGQGNRDIDFGGRAITVRSTDPNDPNIVAATIIDCNGTEAEPHRGFYFWCYEDRGSVVNGLTITNGYESQTQKGGGIYCIWSSPIIANCDINSNSAYNGGGMYNSSYSYPTVISCTFSNNTASSFGGGMGNDNSSPTLICCIFIDNNSANDGGGVYNDKSNPTLDNCSFIMNSSAYDGGGIYSNESKPQLRNCSFIGNSAGENGGAMENFYSSPILNECRFIANLAEGDGGGINNWSGSPLLSNCRFCGNIADGIYGGGGMFNRGSGSCPVLIDCIFNGNYSVNGTGGIGGMFGVPTINICTFSGNASGTNCGGVSGCYEGSLFSNCVFSGNSGSNGGAMAINSADEPILTNCIFGGNYAYSGGGLYIDGGYPELMNCTMARNIADGDGGGIYMYARNNSPQVINCILWNNIDSGGIDESAQIYVYQFSSVTPDVSFSCFKDWTGTFYGLGNIGEDPCFADTESGTWTSEGFYDPNNNQVILINNVAGWQKNELSGKFVNPDTTQPLSFVIVSNTPNTITIWADWQTVNDIDSWIASGTSYEIHDYHLKSEAGRWDTGQDDWVYDLKTSRCIDAGNPGSPLGNEPNEVNNLRIDMGAYGGTSEASKTPENWSLLADLTNDGIADFQDYAAQSQDWQIIEDELPGDLNRNGTIDIIDITLFTEDWLKQTSWAQP